MKSFTIQRVLFCLLSTFFVHFGNAQTNQRSISKYFNCDHPTAKFTVNPVGTDQAVICISKGEVSGITYKGFSATMESVLDNGYRIWSIPIGTDNGGTNDLSVTCTGDAQVVATALEHINQESPIWSAGSDAYMSSKTVYTKINTNPGNIVLDLMEFSSCNSSVQTGNNQRLIDLFCPQNSMGISVKKTDLTTTDISWKVTNDLEGGEIQHTYVVINSNQASYASQPDSAAYFNLFRFWPIMLLPVVVIALILLFQGRLKIPLNPFLQHT